jgi:flagellar motor switch protein FliM
MTIKELHEKCQYITIDLLELLNKPNHNIKSIALKPEPDILNHFIKFTNECKNDFSTEQLKSLNSLNNKFDIELKKPISNKIQNMDSISFFVIDSTLTQYTDKKKIEVINNNKLHTENFLYNNLDLSNKFYYLMKKTMNDIIYI